jgi:hypothetical protein
MTYAYPTWECAADAHCSRKKLGLVLNIFNCLELINMIVDSGY